MAVKREVMVFWVVALCSIVVGNQHVGDQVGFWSSYYIVKTQKTTTSLLENCCTSEFKPTFTVISTNCITGLLVETFQISNCEMQPPSLNVAASYLEK
jgi:hypothetical protein